MLEMPGGNFGVRPVSPEDVSPPGAPNGSAGILIHGKASEALPAPNFRGAVDDRFFGLDEAKSCFREYTAIQCN